MERHPSPARIGGNFEELLNQEAIHDRSYIDMTPGFVTPTGTGYLYYIYIPVATTRALTSSLHEDRYGPHTTPNLYTTTCDDDDGRWDPDRGLMISRRDRRSSFLSSNLPCRASVNLDIYFFQKKKGSLFSKQGCIHPK